MILTGTSNLSQYPGISSDVHRGRRACTDMYTDWPMQCLGLLSTNTSNSSIAMLPPAFAAHAEECLDGLRKGKLTNPIRLLFSTSRYLEWKVCIFVPRSNCYHCRLFLVLHPAMGRGGGGSHCCLTTSITLLAPDLPSIWSAHSPDPKEFSSQQQRYQLGCWGTIILMLWQSL